MTFKERNGRRKAMMKVLDEREKMGLEEGKWCWRSSWKWEDNGRGVVEGG